MQRERRRPVEGHQTSSRTRVCCSVREDRGSSGRAWQSDLQLVPSGHFSVQKHKTRDRHDLDGQKPGRCASIGGFRDRFKTRLIPLFSSAH